MSEEPTKGSGVAFWGGFFLGGVVIGVAVWLITGFGYYKPQLEAANKRADDAEQQSSALVTHMRQQLNDARSAATRAQEAGRVFAQVFQQLDKAFQELGILTEEGAPEGTPTATPETGTEEPPGKAQEAPGAKSEVMMQKGAPSEEKAQTPPEEQEETPAEGKAKAEPEAKAGR